MNRSLVMAGPRKLVAADPLASVMAGPRAGHLARLARPWGDGRVEPGHDDVGRVAERANP